MAIKTQEERFWEKVAVKGPDECWPWLGAKYQSGHGCCLWDGRVTGAHRVAYIVQNGPIPDGLHILHSCDNRVCCNGRHLRAGTNRENVDEKMARGRHQAQQKRAGSYVRGDQHWTRKSSYKPHGFNTKKLAARGERNGNSKLTDKQAAEALARVRAGERVKAVAADYGVAFSTIYRIVNLTTHAALEEGQEEAHSLIEQRKRGLGRYNAKLTPETIAQIKKRTDEGAYQWQIAKELGISQALVSRALNGLAGANL